MSFRPPCLEPYMCGYLWNPVKERYGNVKTHAHNAEQNIWTNVKKSSKMLTIANPAGIYPHKVSNRDTKARC